MTVAVKPTVVWLKKAVQLKQPKGVKYFIHQALAGYRPSRGHKFIHASELTKPGEEYCPRATAIMDLLHYQHGNEFISTASAVTYDLGRHLQDRLVHWLADAGRAICHWKCLACGSMQHFCKRPASCPSCGCQSFSPREPVFKSAVSGAQGSIDVLAYLDTPLLRIVEVKTIMKEDFANLKAPIAEHRLRTNLYMRIVKESGHEWAPQIDTEQANIIYVCKGGYKADDSPADWGLKDAAFSPFMEFVVQRDDAATEPYVKKAKAVTDFRSGVAGMPCAVCANSLVKRAKFCPVREQCFSDSYPVGMANPNVEQPLDAPVDVTTGEEDNTDE